jgi:tRNA (cmo5U34)-methyltransferase
MSQFEKTRWADDQFVQEYRDDAGIYLPYRKQCFEIVKSSVHFFFTGNQRLRVLDLGCGDGLFVQELLQSCKVEKVVLLDGSGEMLASAQKRLAGVNGLEFVRASFQELHEGDPLVGQEFDFIFSSLAIHHLILEQKGQIYSYAFNHLAPTGLFLNYDIVMAPTQELEAWSMFLWRLWIEGHPDQEGAARLRDIPEKYKANSDNIPDSLDAQLDLLREIGFGWVDCFYKYGAFTLFGGRRF